MTEETRTTTGLAFVLVALACGLIPADGAEAATLIEHRAQVGVLPYSCAVSERWPLAAAGSVSLEFTTGPNPQGYRLTGLRILLRGTSLDDSVGSGVLLDGSTEILSLGSKTLTSSALENLEPTFTPIRLNANKTYAIRITNSGSHGMAVCGRAGATQTLASGWTLSADTNNDSLKPVMRLTGDVLESPEPEPEPEPEPVPALPAAGLVLLAGVLTVRGAVRARGGAL